MDEYKALNNLSIREIRYKLYSKGISNNLIEDYVTNHLEELIEYEMDSARKIVLKKANIMQKDAIIQFLLKKGYLEESVRYAIKDEE